MAKAWRHYTPEFKERAIDLCLQAVVMGDLWSISRFCRVSGIPKVTMLTWLGEDANFDRYKRAMELKALELPLKANDIVRQVIEGKPVKYTETGVNGATVEKVKQVFLDPKAARVVLQHIEFRIQREIKKMYEPTRTVKHEGELDRLSDAEIERRYLQLQERLLSGGTRGPADAEPQKPHLDG